MRDLKKQENLKPTLLTDKTRLEEIYQLRVLAWEHTDYSKFINRQLFPYGFSDHLDNNGYHFIIENDKKEIIGSNRFNILHDLNDLTEPDFYCKFTYPQTRPFGFLSRLVIHPDYRGLKLSTKFDQAVIEFSRQKEICFSIVGIFIPGLNQLTEKGFKVLGKADYSLFHDSKIDEGYVLIYENSHEK